MFMKAFTHHQKGRVDCFGSSILPVHRTLSCVDIEIEWLLLHRVMKLPQSLHLLLYGTFILNSLHLGVCD